jgi:hypothetical protein
MTHDFLTETRDATHGDNLITLGSHDGPKIEMTRTNHLQLQREMARMIDNCFDTLMEQVAVEFREMTGTLDGPEAA